MGQAIPWVDFARIVDGLYAPPQRSTATASKVRSVLAAYREATGAETTEAIGPDGLAKFVAATSDLNPTTVRGYLGYLAPLFKAAHKMGFCEINPFDIRPPGQWVLAPEIDDDDWEDDEDERYLGMEEIRKFLAWTGARTDTWEGHRLHALASLLVYTGVRRNEALYRKVRDVDLDARVVKIRARRRARLKTRASSAPVPMPPALVETLAGWIPHAGPEWLFPGVLGKGPWTGGSAGGRPIGQLRAAGIASGVGPVTFLMLRHTYATQAEAWGLSDLMIQRVLRHTTVKTQRHYRHADVANLANAVADIDYRRGA